jgi:hypothetical protein
MVESLHDRMESSVEFCDTALVARIMEGTPAWWRPLEGSDENSTGPAVEYGDVAHVDQNCPVPARRLVSRRMHRLIDIYAHACAFDPEQVRIVTAAFDQTWQAVQDTGTPFTRMG